MNNRYFKEPIPDDSNLPRFFLLEQSVSDVELYWQTIPAESISQIINPFLERFFSCVCFETDTIPKGGSYLT